MMDKCTQRARGVPSLWIVQVVTRKRFAELLENIGADDVRFTSSELAELNEAVSAIHIRGARLPDQGASFLRCRGAAEEVRSEVMNVAVVPSYSRSVGLPSTIHRTDGAKRCRTVPRPGRLCRL
jgi:hypothetical protein